MRVGHDDLLLSEKGVDHPGKQRMEGGPGDILKKKTVLKGPLFKDVHTNKEDLRCQHYRGSYPICSVKSP